MRDLVEVLRAASRDANRVRPTTAGTWGAVLVAGVMFGAVNTGNNLVYLVLGGLLALLLLNNVLAEWNLRDLRVERRLPGELHAGVAAVGSFVVTNLRARGAAWRVEVTDLDVASPTVVAPLVAAGGEVEVLARWTMPRRGQVRLARLRVGSRYPFGLIHRYRDVMVPVDVLVYPGIGHPGARARMEGDGESEAEGVRRGGVGDHAGMRPWRAGDPLRSVHARTSARVGQLVVVERVAASPNIATVEVRPNEGEAGVSRACAEVLAHAATGAAVGLVGPGWSVSPATGDAARRHLLERLALLELPA